jgi:hypothetical protein
VAGNLPATRRRACLLKKSARADLIHERYLRHGLLVELQGLVHGEIAEIQ